MPRTGVLLAVVLVVLVGATPAHARIVYSKGVNQAAVYVANDDGSGARRLVAGNYPTLSPNGRWVAYLRDGKPRLIRATGGASRALPAGGADAVFSPDSRLLAGESRRGLVLYEIVSRDSALVTSGSMRGYSFSPDSGSIAFAKAASRSDFDAASDIYVLSGERVRPTRITRDRVSRFPLWTAQGIVFTKQFDRQRGEGVFPRYELFEMAPDGTAVREITDASIEIDDITYGPVAIARSPDGSRLLASVIGQSRDDAWGIDAATGTAHTFGVDVVPGGLSRDGSTVVMHTRGIEPGSFHDIITMPWEGGTATTLIRRAMSPSWNR